MFVFSGLAASAQPSFLKLLFGTGDVQVITDSDVYALEEEIPRPAPGKPVYYLAVSVGFQEFGSPMPGEKVPDQKDVLKIVTKTLESQGYKLATNKNPPSLIIAYAWGTLHVQRLVAPSSSLPTVTLGRGRVFEFLGGKKLTQGGSTIDPFSTGGAPFGLQGGSTGARDFWDLANDGYYVVKLNAYDLNHAKQQNAKVLWSTRMSASHRGLWLADALPIMLSIGAPNIGKHTDKPVLVYASDRYKPSIEVGPATVVEEDVR